MSCNPGSEEAIKKGCTCARMDNNRGRGFGDPDNPSFWISADCPLHGSARWNRVKK